MTTALLSAWWLSLAVMTAAPDEGRVQLLVERLGSARFEDRRQAEEELEALRGRALPALRKARNEARDLEIKTRSAALIERIEKALVTEPTLVQLGRLDRPLAALAQDLAIQSGFPVQAAPGQGDRTLPADRRQDLQPFRPFWLLADELADRFDLAAALDPVTDARGLNLGIVFGPRRGARPLPTCYHGPIRVRVVHLGVQRTINLEPAQPQEPAEKTLCAVRLRVSAEPRLTLGHAGAARVAEAIDDRGRSLRLDMEPPPAVRSLLPADIEYTGGPELFLTIALGHPGDRLGGRLSRFSGTIPLAVVGRRSDPVAMKLATDVGKSFSNDDRVVSLADVQAQPVTGRVFVQLVLRPRPGTLAPDAETALPSAAALVDQQIEAFDAEGRALNVSLAGSEVDRDALRLRLQLAPIDQAGPPETLTFHSLSRDVITVPFRFADVPLP